MVVVKWPRACINCHEDSRLTIFQPFRNFYGTEDNPEGGRNIGAAWQSGIQNGVQVGSIIGLWLNGIISDKIGYRKVSASTNVQQEVPG
jgi:hypothetical protein